MNSSSRRPIHAGFSGILRIIVAISIISSHARFKFYDSYEANPSDENPKELIFILFWPLERDFINHTGPPPILESKAESW